MWFSRLFWKLIWLCAALLVALAGVLLVVALWTEPAESAAALWIAAFAGVGLALAIAYLVVGRLVAPLDRLAQAAEVIAAHDNEQPVPVESRDELGRMAAAFNQLQRKLHGRVEQLRENSERLQTVLGNMAEGVIAVDAAQTITLVNEAGRTLVDAVTADAVGRPLLEVTRIRAVHDCVSQALAAELPVERQIESIGATRRTLALRATKLPGEPSPGVMVVLHDITELRRLENLRRELVANVSHELKTPLASIKAYAETLRLGAIHDPEHNLAFVGRIEEQADRLHQLILDLLQIARIEAGQEVFDIGAVPVAATVEQCLGHYRGAAATKSIRLAMEAPREPLSVLADDEGLLAILSNLVDNAIKYTPEAGTVTVRWRQADGKVLIEVQDTGIGISPTDQARVFERFYRVDKARSRELGGTGLGLSIVKHLAQAFQGSVTIVSKPRQGSTFCVTLPKA